MAVLLPARFALLAALAVSCHGMRMKAGEIVKLSEGGNASSIESTDDVWLGHRPRPHVLLSELAGVAGNLSDGLGRFGASWKGPETMIFLRWVEGRISKFINFSSNANPFVNRPIRSHGTSMKKSDSDIFELRNFSTSDDRLEAWVENAGGAYLCLANSDGWDTSWAILPKDNGAWQIGCNSGGWKGRGAYYGDDHYGAGWVGVKESGQPKAGKPTIVVGLEISISEAEAPTAAPTEAPTAAPTEAPTPAPTKAPKSDAGKLAGLNFSALVALLLLVCRA